MECGCFCDAFAEWRFKLDVSDKIAFASGSSTVHMCRGVFFATSITYILFMANSGL